MREAGPRQRGKQLTRPRSALRGGGGDRGADCSPPVRVLLRSAKHLFLAAKPRSGRARAVGDRRALCLNRELSGSRLSRRPGFTFCFAGTSGGRMPAWRRRATPRSRAPDRDHPYRGLRWPSSVSATASIPIRDRINQFSAIIASRNRVRLLPSGVLFLSSSAAATRPLTADLGIYWIPFRSISNCVFVIRHRYKTRIKLFLVFRPQSGI